MIKYIRTSLLLIYCFSIADVSAQFPRFNIGLNLRLAVLPHVQTKFFDLVNGYDNHELDVLASLPVSFRYYTKSIWAFQYQIEYRNEDYFSYELHEKNTYAGLRSDCSYLVNNLNVLIRIDSLNDKRTCFSAGIKYFNSLSQKYIYHNQSYGYDSSSTYSSSDFNHLKTALNLSFCREKCIGQSAFSFYWELFYNIIIYQKSEDYYDIPVFYSNEIGLTVGVGWFCK